MIDYVPPVYASALPVVILFALGALLICYFEKKQQVGNSSVDHFLAAKRTQPFWRIAYSLASTSLGAWVLFSVPSFAIETGYIGLISYSVGCGCTIILPVIFGPLIIEQTKDTAISMNDFVQKRWGNIAKIFVTVVSIYNMGIGIISEFTAIGDFFENVVHGSRILIVVLIGCLTSIYIAFGGLSVSVKTDQIQGVIVCIMFIFTIIYVSCTFRMSEPRPPLPDYLGATTAGYNSIVAMTISLLASVAFSEVKNIICNFKKAFWQKAWIAQSKQVLRKASLCAGIFIFVIVGTFGVLGWIAAWDGRHVNDPNLAFFGIFGNQVPKGVMVVIAILACVMNESAVDSYQLGITCSVSACFFKDKPLYITQILVVLLNIPCIVLSLKNFGIVNLFLSGNLICTACMGPLLLGVSTKLKPYYDSIALITSSILGLFFAALWGCLNQHSFKKGLKLIFYDSYAWESFTLALCVSTLAVLIQCAGKFYYYKRNGIYIKIKDQENEKVSPANLDEEDIKSDLLEKILQN